MNDLIIQVYNAIILNTALQIIQNKQHTTQNFGLFLLHYTASTLNHMQCTNVIITNYSGYKVFTALLNTIVHLNMHLSNTQPQNSSTFLLHYEIDVCTTRNSLDFRPVYLKASLLLSSPTLLFKGCFFPLLFF